MNTEYYVYYLRYLSSMYDGYPFVFRMTVVMVLILSLITLFAIVRLLLIGYRLERRAKRCRILREQYEEKCRFLMSNETVYELKEVQKLLDFNPRKATSWQHEILTDLMLEVRDQLESEEKLNTTNYKHCVEAFRLAPFWEKRIKNAGHIARKAALQKMASLDFGLNGGLLSKSVYHSDKHLRKAARSIYTDQEDYHPFRFMEDNFDESFDQLDKVRLHATLYKRSLEGRLPNLLRWITHSKNFRYVAFVIREIGFFRQYEAAPSLISLLQQYENTQVRVQIIRTLGTLGYDDAVPTLMARYELESNAVRQAIVETLGIIKGDSSLQFLLESYDNTEDNYFKISIVRAIRQYGEAGIRCLERLGRSGAADEKLIINQVFAEKLVYTSY